MAYIYKKTIGDKTYYYLRASERHGKRIITKDIAYLGSSLEEAGKALKAMPRKKTRDAHKSIRRFFDQNVFLEKAKALKLKNSSYLDRDLLEQVEACRLHFNAVFGKLPQHTRRDYLRNFVIDFAFNTTSIEGNTITLKEATRLLTENLTPKNKTLREIYDVQNTERVFFEIMDSPPLISHETVQYLHASLMTDIDPRTGYRTEDVHVLRARFEATPAPYIRADMTVLNRWLQKEGSKIHPLVRAGIFHHKFEKVHPFFDGNGRTGRMLLNSILLKDSHPPLIVRKRNRANYLDALSKADSADLTSTKPQHYKPLIEFLATEYIETYWNSFL